MIRFATDSMLPALKRLWMACFGDTADYVDFLFARLLCPEHILVDEIDGQPVAMLCIEPAVLAVGSAKAEAAYLYGVATSPDRQGEGRSTALLEECHRRLAPDGFALSMLVPAGESLFRFYGKRGYQTAFHIAKIDLAASEIPAPAAPCALAPAHLADLAPIREETFSRGGPFVRWSRDWLRYIGEECALLGGEVLRLECDGAPGYAVCYRDQEQVVVKELAVDERLFDVAAAALHARYRAQRYRFYLPADHPRAANRVLPFAMVRWYDKKKQQLLVPEQGTAGWIAHVLD